MRSALAPTLPPPPARIDYHFVEPEPDERWKATLRRRIENDLSHMIEDAQTACDKILNSRPSKTKRKHAECEYEESMNVIRLVAEDEFNREMAIEMSERKRALDAVRSNYDTGPHRAGSLNSDQLRGNSIAPRNHHNDTARPLTQARERIASNIGPDQRQMSASASPHDRPSPPTYPTVASQAIPGAHPPPLDDAVRFLTSASYSSRTLFRKQRSPEDTMEGIALSRGPTNPAEGPQGASWSSLHSRRSHGDVNVHLRHGSNGGPHLPPVDEDISDASDDTVGQLDDQQGVHITRNMQSVGNKEVEQMTIYWEAGARCKEGEATREEEEATRTEDEARRHHDEGKAQLSLEKAQRPEPHAHLAEVSVKIREAAVQKKEAEVSLRELDTKKREADLHRQEDEFRLKEAEALLKEEEVTRKEGNARKREAKVNLRELETKKREADLHEREEEFRLKMAEALRKEEEVTRREEEVTHREGNTRVKEEEARRLEEMSQESLKNAQRLESGAREAEVSAKMHEAAAQKREADAMREEAKVKKREAEVQMREAEVQTREAEVQTRETEARGVEEARHRHGEVCRLGGKAQQSLEEAKRLDANGYQAEVSVKMHEAAAQQKVADIVRRESEAKRLEAEVQYKEAEIRRREEEARKKEEEVRLLEERARRSLEEAERFDASTCRAEASSKMCEAQPCRGLVPETIHEDRQPYPSQHQAEPLTNGAKAETRDIEGQLREKERYLRIREAEIQKMLRTADEKREAMNLEEDNLRQRLAAMGEQEENLRRLEAALTESMAIEGQRNSVDRDRDSVSLASIMANSPRIRSNVDFASKSITGLKDLENYSNEG